MNNAESIDMKELLQVDGELLSDCHAVAMDLLPACHDGLPSVKEFRLKHAMTTNEFTSLRRKAERKYPGMVFSAKDAEGVHRVENASVLEGLIEPKEAVEAELVETTELSNGGALTVRKQSYDITLPEMTTTHDYSYQVIDTSNVTTLVNRIQEDLYAEAEAARISRLYEFANEAVKAQADKALIETLIAKGYAPEQAVKIAMGVQ